MSNIEKTKPETVIIIDGNEYTLKFNLNAFRMVHEDTGWNLLDDSLKIPNPNEILSLLYAGIKTYHPDVDKEELGNKIDITDLEKIFEVISKVLRRSSPESTDSKGDKKKVVKNKKPTG